MKHSLFDNLPLKPEYDPIMMGLHGGYNLAAPWSFWTADAELRRAVVNGCGPGKAGDWLVPDNIIGLNAKPSCEIHDWMFAVYNCKEGFDLSNNLFKNNLIRSNRQHVGMGFMKKARIPIILGYFFFVHWIGEPSYYDAHLALV